MDLLTAIETEPLFKIQKIVLQKGLLIDSSWLDYDALNRALAYKRNDVAKWLIEQYFCRVNKISDSNRSILDSTPLHNAVKLGDMEILEMLLKNEASVVAVDSNDNTALHISFLYRYDKITDLLLDHIVQKSTYVNKKNNQGLSHLHIACSRNNVKALEGYLNAKADIEGIVKADSPISWAGYTALHFAIASKSLEAAKILLAVYNSMNDEYFMSDHLDKSASPHFHPVCCKERANIVKKPINKGQDMGESSRVFKSPRGREENVEILSKNATVRCHCKHNHMILLHMAFYNEYHMNDFDGTIVDYLYKAVRNKEKNFEDENELSYFHIAVTRNDLVAVETHLDSGANVNQAVLPNDRGFSGYTALLFSVHYRLVDMAKFLIERGANVNARAIKKHQTPLFKALQMKNIAMIKLLLESGARLHKKADPLGNTLLHYAAELGSDEIVKYLIDSGRYNVNRRNNLGKTPLIVSLEVDKPCPEVVEILLNKGADVFAEDNNDDYAIAIINSSKWLIADTGRLRIFTMFLQVESDLELFYLLEEVNEGVIEMLLQTGIDLSAKYDNGDTLLHLLAKNSNPGVIEQLRGHDFDVNARNNQGWTPFLMAALNGISNAVEFFLDEGADIAAAEYVGGRTSLYLAVDPSSDTVEEYKKCVQVLLEHGANAQVEIVGNANPTILDEVSRNQYFELGELVLAHLAFQEANGTAITELIRLKINSHDRFKSYYEFCQQELSGVIFNSVTLFDVLAASERKLEGYLRRKVIASKLKIYQSVDYFKNVLSKRLPGRIAIVELRKAAEPVVCELMMIDYDSYPGITEEIVGYLEKQDLENLISTLSRPIFN